MTVIFKVYGQTFWKISTIYAEDCSYIYIYFYS